MTFDPLHYHYKSKRTVSYSCNGMVATCHPLATQAGLDMLKRGGNAIDAAVATATALTVLEPTSNGIGGDAFALVDYDGSIYGLNASGPAPMAISADAIDSIPRFGWPAVTVPGAPAAWIALIDRFGSLPLKVVFEPAIRYAREGHPIAPLVGYYWKKAFETFTHTCSDPYHQHWFDTFAPHGNPPKAGQIWKSEAHARTLQEIAETNGDSFYRGNLAQQILSFAQKTGGLLSQEDLCQFYPEWVQPLSVQYRGFTVYELPPNGQGLIALIALGILSNLCISHRQPEQILHHQIESIKIAFREGLRHITDPKFMHMEPKQLIQEDQLRCFMAEIMNHAVSRVEGDPMDGGTVYLTTADRHGNMVSYIQSNYMGFGSGLVVPNTGIALHNRGCNFSLDRSHPNFLVSGKRPYHTIIPGFMKAVDGTKVSFGVMGGFMQPQGHIQIIGNLLDHCLNPQDALNAPRWMWTRKNRVLVEKEFPAALRSSLSKMGHEIEITESNGVFGRGQIIWRDRNAVYCGGTEPRADGSIAVW